MKNSDIYCDQILSGALDVDIIEESANVLVFRHTQPYWETHLVVIPKKHIESLATITAQELPILNELLTSAARICARQLNTVGGCRLSTNVGSYQTSKHLHFYIHAGARLRNEDGIPAGDDH